MKKSISLFLITLSLTAANAFSSGGDACFNGARADGYSVSTAASMCKNL